jgi:plasmid stabilization system protein ParE
MKFDVRLSAAAERSLRETMQWYRERSGAAEVGRLWKDGFLAALESLRERPDRLPLATESDSFPFELRRLLYDSGRRKTHRALFRITGDVVEVIAIRHVSQRDLEPGDV